MGSRILQDFRNAAEFSTDIGDVLLALVVSFACGVIVSIVYRLTYRGASYSASLVRSMIILSMITAVVMLVIGNNLARAFGLVGAMSIIRFRTALKDPHDIVFVFFALAAGMAAGVGLHVLALVSTVGIGLVIYVTTRVNYAVADKQAFILRFDYAGAADEDAATYLPILKRYCKSSRLINVREAGDGRTELTFFADLRDEDQRQQLTRDLAATAGVSRVSLFYDTEQL
ncbi:MAG: DUF4956 domain-containing protein [Rhodothermales bacterium]|nr:DUF4956 domain-containing protein [Rhodothermales bacterium]